MSHVDSLAPAYERASRIRNTANMRRAPLAGLVAVPSPMVGGFHVYLTGGLHDASRWVRGDLEGWSYVETLADLKALAERAGRQLRKVGGVYALEAR